MPPAPPRSVATAWTIALAALLLPLAGCAASHPKQTTSSTEAEPEPLLVPAAPDRGFEFPYLLRVPPAKRTPAPLLLVEPNNSGHVSPDLAEHVNAALPLARRGMGGDVARRMGAPFLMPVFPRSETLYTHSLDRRTLLTDDPRLHRLDLQLLAMIRDARERLAAQGIQVRERVLLTGFSASAMFVTRFAALHPEAVEALAAGGINGFVILPLEKIGDTDLPFPLGIADLSQVNGAPFAAEQWRRIPQFLFMGGRDENDAVANDDAYPESERTIIHRLLGAKMLPDRWEQCQRFYREAAPAVRFVTYPEMGHGTNGRIHTEIARFLGN